MYDNLTLSLIHLTCKHWNNISNGKCKISPKVLKARARNHGATPEEKTCSATLEFTP